MKETTQGRLLEITGICPHCREAVSCGILDNKQQVVCENCNKKLFSPIQDQLKRVNMLFFLPLLPPVIGMGVRDSLGMSACLALILVGAALLFGVLFLERYFCVNALRKKD